MKLEPRRRLALGNQIFELAEYNPSRQCGDLLKLIAVNSLPYVVQLRRGQ